MGSIMLSIVEAVAFWGLVVAMSFSLKSWKEKGVDNLSKTKRPVGIVKFLRGVCLAGGLAMTALFVVQVITFLQGG